MPRRGELGINVPITTISSYIKQIDESRFRGAGYCDEIVNSALMEIATGRSSCSWSLEWTDENDGLQSVAWTLTVD